MVLDTVLDSTYAEQNRVSGELIDRVRKEGLSYPLDFESRLDDIRLRDGKQRTFCWATALYLLGLTNTPVIQESRGVISINTRNVANFLISQRTVEQIDDNALLGKLKVGQPVNEQKCPLILVVNKQMPTSVHWAVADPKNPNMIHQTTEEWQPLVNTTLERLIETGNFGFQSSLKEARGEWTIHFCR